MTDLTSTDWKELDADNTSPSPNGVQGGYSPSQVAPVIRAIRGSLKRFYNQSNAIYTSTGTATAYVLTFQAAPSGYSKGIVYRFWAHASNTGAATLNINSLGEKSIVSSADGSALISGQIISGRMVEVVYNGTTFELLSETKLNSKLSGNTVLTGPLTINGAAGTDRLVGWRSSDKQRWAAFTNAAPETGGNLGSDFAVARYADDGNYIDAPLSINRKEGTVYIEKGLVVKDTVYVGNAGAALYADGNLKFVGNMATNQGATYLSDALNGKQPNLGFTPVQQGTGFNQGNNTVKIGWSANSKLRLTVDSTDFGWRWPLDINGMSTALKEGGSDRAMTFYWNGQPGTPDWLWGGYDGTNMYVFSPSNISVKNAAQLGGFAASDYATKADLNASSSAFQSGNQTYTTNGMGSVAHGLGKKPNWYIAEMVCTTASNGWAVGDSFDMASGTQPWSGQGHFGLHIWATATTVNWKVAVNGIVILNKSGGGGEVAPSANWALRFRAGY